ncbi:hypothetical protein T492DRAFT_879186, partial [Pavlovales sp. CCMP2436]
MTLAVRAACAALLVGAALARPAGRYIVTFDGAVSVSAAAFSPKAHLALLLKAAPNGTDVRRRYAAVLHGFS